MSEPVDIDYAVAGAGVVGLACARALALAGHSVALFEAESAIGQGVSSRSSEVIHAGLYYPTGSLKARLCVAGAAALYRYCASRGVAHRRTGKLIVACSPAEHEALATLHRQSLANGAAVVHIGAAAAREREPALRCHDALWSPDTGIVDSHALMQALADDAEAAGAMRLMRAPVLGGTCTGSGVTLEIGGATPYRVRCRGVVNAAGLAACALATRLEGFPPAAIPTLHLAKGHYFALSGPSPFAHLIYPLPEPGGLGIHLTLDLDGRARFGPDVAWIDSPGYDVPETLSARFAASISRYWPGLDAGRLRPAYAGVRPKLGGPGASTADFRIDGPAHHGVAGVVQLFGIESPGLTAALAIAEHVTGLLRD